MVRIVERSLADLQTKLDDIRSFLREGCADPDIRSLAQEILDAAGPYQVTLKDPWTLVVVLYRWVQQHVPFERDPLTDEVLDLGNLRVEGPVDLIQNAAATLERGKGDCVALSVLLGSLACAMGFPIHMGLQDIAGRGVDHFLLFVGLPPEAPQDWFPVDLTASGPGELRSGAGPLQRLPL